MQNGRGLFTAGEWVRQRRAESTCGRGRDTSTGKRVKSRASHCWASWGHERGQRGEARFSRPSRPRLPSLGFVLKMRRSFSRFPSRSWTGLVTIKANNWYLLCAKLGPEFFALPPLILTSLRGPVIIIFLLGGSSPRLGILSGLSQGHVAKTRRSQSAPRVSWRSSEHPSLASETFMENLCNSITTMWNQVSAVHTFKAALPTSLQGAQTSQHRLALVPC